MTLILETLGTPDEETMTQVASEKVRSRSGKILHFFIVLMPVVGSYLLEDFANLRKERSEEYFPRRRSSR